MKGYKIITLGMAGGQIGKVLLSQGIDAVQLAHFDTDLAINYLDMENKFLVGEGKASIYDYKAVDDLFERYLHLFERTIESDVLYILVCGLGGKTGTALMVNLSKLLRENHKEFVIVTSMPCKFEGIRRISIASQVLSELELLSGKNLILLPLDDMIISDMNLPELFNKADQFATTVIKGILMKYEVCYLNN